MTCLLSTALIFESAAQQQQFPNELAGYEFFAKGRLSSVVFGETKRSDIVSLFGSDCESFCDYDERFSIKFDYLDLSDCMTTRQIRDRAVCPLDQYIDTIESIKFAPKNTILIEGLPTDIFEFRTSGGTFSKEGGQGTYYEAFTDGYGLRYSFRRDNGTTHFPLPKFVGGELYSIEYVFSEKLETDIFRAPFKKAN